MEPTSLELDINPSVRSRSPSVTPRTETRVYRVELTDTGVINTVLYAPSPEPQPPPASNISAQIFAVLGDDDLHGTPGPWDTLFDSKLWSRFLEAHCDDSEDLQRELEQEGVNVIFLNWERLEAQSQEQYGIEKRIQAGKPYDVDTFRDPEILRLNHRRYERLPKRPFRKYGIISSSEDDSVLYHAAKERISFGWGHVGGVFTGIMLLDPIRRYVVREGNFNSKSDCYDWVDEKVPCFLEQQTCQGSLNVGSTDSVGQAKTNFDGQQHLRRFVNILEVGCKEFTTTNDLQLPIERALVQLVSEDLMPVIEKMGCTLDTIELALHDDTVLQTSLSKWRNQLSTYRNILFHQSESLLRRSAGIKMKSVTAATSKRIDPAFSWAAISDPKHTQDVLLAWLHMLSSTVERTHKRVENDHQALMLSMSIVESERAIAEAAVVSKLTQLAFFFIPLSLVAGVFGMNINVSKFW
ncbi:hypothetical protein TWF730_002510 [Orbilia blumenaviensis]|uniref:Uncharacterized protein n=1 Tax=Orbilia blumenaviensis TaxID=1796055 RepID=A0AAV9UA47_9PEZI